MKISEWLDDTFGGDWFYSNVKGIWIDRDNVNREAFIVGDNLRVVEHKVSSIEELKR